MEPDRKPCWKGSSRATARSGLSCCVRQALADEDVVTLKSLRTAKRPRSKGQEARTTGARAVGVCTAIMDKG